MSHPLHHVLGGGRIAPPGLPRLAVIALVAGALACGGTPDAAHDGPPAPDAAVPLDARPPIDAAADAPPDGSPAIDLDHDGHAADQDCDDHDPTVWQHLAYHFRDSDGDGHSVIADGTICSGASLPPGYATVSSGTLDCDDADPAAFTRRIGFLDGDGDGVGAGVALAVCTGDALPAGFAPVGGDCAPVDPARWVDLPYAFRDADGDGAAIAELGTVCSGAALPPGYLTAAPAGRPLDCDDSNPAIAIALTVFADADGDGVGAGPGQLACTAGTPPPGFSITGTDCDDADPAVRIALMYTAVDFDGDGATAPELGTRCTAGALLPPYFAVPHGDDCDDTNPAISIALTIFADGDLDGFGAGPGQLACTGGAPPAGFSTAGTDCDDGDAAAWALVAYHAIDGDGDGVTVPASGQLCTDGTLPPPFLATPNGNDCDDDDPALTHLAVLYPDHDGDGVGAPPRARVCIGATVPAGFARGGYDDNDDDPAVIETDDSDDLVDLMLQ